MTSETRSPRAGRFSRKTSRSASASERRDGGARDGQEYRVEIHHRHPRRRQRAAEDQHADESVDPSARRLVHSDLLLIGPLSRGGLVLPETDAVQLRRTVMADGRYGWMSRRAGGHGETLIAIVMGAIRQRIGARSLTPGAKLPSIRAFATTMQVSKSTVVEAYERLVAEGAIRSRPGSGYLCRRAPCTAVAGGDRAEARPRDRSALDIPAVAGGWRQRSKARLWLASASWMPQEGLRRALRTLSRADDVALVRLRDAARPSGAAPAPRAANGRAWHRGLGRPGDPDANPGTQAIDLICRFLIEPGDTVLVDDPCYFNFHALLRAHRAKVVSAPYTPQAPTSTCSPRRSPSIGRASTSPIRQSTIRPARRCRRSSRIAF